MGRKERLPEYFKRLTQAERDIVVGMAAELYRDKVAGPYIQLPLDKQELLETEFGSKMVNVIAAWDQALEKPDRETNPEVQEELTRCLAQWEVCQMVMRQFYGIEYHFTRTDENFGICTEDESDWLVKVDRELETLSRYVKAIKRYEIPDQVYLDNVKMECKDQISDSAVSDAAGLEGYYEDIIHSKIPARTGVEKVIQEITSQDAGVVLVMIGMEHPASKVVYKYLVEQKLKQYDGSRCYLLNRWRRT